MATSPPKILRRERTPLVKPIGGRRAQEDDSIKAIRLSRFSFWRCYQVKNRDCLLLSLPFIAQTNLDRIHYLHSLSEGNGNTVTGLCLGVSRRKNNGKFWMVFNLAGVPIQMCIPMNSPLVTQFEIVQRGTGNIRVKTILLELHRLTLP